MSKNEKLLNRFLNKPKDFTWNEYVKIFSIYGFELKSGSGSRRSFVNENKDIFHIHEPHPESIMKSYAIKQAIEWLTEKGLLNSDTEGESDEQSKT